MSIEALKFRNMYGIQKTQGVQQSSQSQNVQSSQSSGNLMERLNNMDNKLNQGGGVSLSDSNAGQAGGQEEMIRKHHKFM
jgi:hypothetical protein